MLYANFKKNEILETKPLVRLKSEIYCALWMVAFESGFIIREFRQQEALYTFQCLAMSPDTNPIEHIWDIIGRKVHQRNRLCSNIAELTSTILE